MRLGKKGDKKAKMESIGRLRKNQMITTFGPGGIVEMPEYTVIMAATDYWSNWSPIIYEPTLKRLLGVKYFKEPYASESDLPKGNPDVPAFRFPRMHFCPKCEKLDDFKAFGDPKNKKCIDCNSDLVPSRFIAACVNGHLEDFPYEWWVHYGSPYKCDEPDNHHKLKMIFKNDTGGLASIVIKCTKCGKERSMEGCMSKDALTGYKCFGRRPWIGSRVEYNDSEECTAVLRALQRGASNAYFGMTKSALTIPPWSSKIQCILDEKWEDIQTAYDNKMDEEFRFKLISILFKKYIEDGLYTVDDIIKEIDRRINCEDDENEYTDQMMYEDEYKALCAGYSPEDEETPEQFEAEETDISDSLEDFFDEVVLVKRLREVIAFKGFRRILPVAPSEEERASEGANNNEFMPPWNKRQEWLPATEMRGEGIFIKLNERRVTEWEKQNADRYLEMKERMKIDVSEGMYSPRYVLLHTLSHLLIRQLTMDCGYQEAAIKERIYSTFPESKQAMCGILIYTSASDSDGSLGGLVRQGESDLLEDTVRNALQEASWCSSDPLCIDSKSQGFYSLNYAACHACVLLPETSCVARNCLLDRVAVVGKMSDRSLGYFGELMEE